MKRFSQYFATAAVSVGLLTATFTGTARAAQPNPLTAAPQRSEASIQTITGQTIRPLLTFGPVQNQPQAQPQKAPAGGNPTPQAPQPNGKTIFIDPGHGSTDTGAVHKDANGNVDLTEADVNLAISLKLADMLRQNGYNVVMSRTDNHAPAMDQGTAADLQARIDEANAAGADLFICVHNNATGSPNAEGTEVYYCSNRSFSADNIRLAKLVDQGIVNSLHQAGYNAKDEGAQDDASFGHFAVLAPSNTDRPTKMPGIIGESLYMTNDQDAAKLHQPQIQQAIAQGYLQGIQAYFNNSNA